MPSGRGALFVIAVGLWSSAIPSPAQPQVKYVCIDMGLDDEFLELDIPRLVVGCAKVDCCPGCPGPPYKIEWEIRVAGELVAGAEFRMVGADRQAERRLRLNGRPIRGGVIAVDPGRSALTGVEFDPAAAKVAIHPRIRLDRPALKRVLEKARRAPLAAGMDLDFDAAARTLSTATIALEQRIGTTVVNHWELEVQFQLCTPIGVLPTRCGAETWECVGPHHISGAMRQVVVDPTERRRLYGVSANGGLWVLDDVDNYPAQLWRPLTDSLPRLRFRTMAVAPGNGRVLYAANSVKELSVAPIRVYSEMYRSDDRGLTWSPPMQDPNMGVIHRIAVHPANENVVFAASSTGLWKLPSAGAGWARLRSDDCMDLALDPTDSSIIYAAVRDIGIFKSFTSGSDWGAAPLLTRDPNTANRSAIKLDLGRSRGAVAETPVDRTVVVRFGDEICISHTAGEGGDSAWRRTVPFVPDPNGNNLVVLNNDLAGGTGRRSDTNPRRGGEWNNCLAVDPRDPNHILVGSVGLLESRDGGLTWSRRSRDVSRGIPHEDQQSIAFDAQTPDLVYVANDGGIFSSIDGGASWPRPRMGFGTTDPAIGRGTYLARGLVTAEIRRSVVADGRAFAAIDHSGFVVSDDFNNRWQFLLNNADDSGAHGHESSCVFRCPASPDRFYVIDVRDALRLKQIDFVRSGGLIQTPELRTLSARSAGFPVGGAYFPEQAIYQDNVLGPFAVTVAGDERRLIFGARRSEGSAGGLIETIRIAADGTLDSEVFDPNGDTLFVALAFAPTDPNHAFAIDQNGGLFERNGDTGPFTPLGQWMLPDGDRFPLRLLVVEAPTLRIYALAQHSLGRFDHASSTWTTVHTWPDQEETFLSLAIEPSDPNSLALGTSRGVYVSSSAGSAWSPLQGRLPRVPVSELTFNQQYLYAATYGRGLWRCIVCK